jgi:hypothetical protein
VPRGSANTGDRRDLVNGPIAYRSFLFLRAPRRRSPDATEECWQVFYGDVRVGTIAKRVGIPPDQAPWGWSCGFYPGIHPGQALKLAAKCEPIRLSNCSENRPTDREQEAMQTLLHRPR